MHTTAPDLQRPYIHTSDPETPRRRHSLRLRTPVAAIAIVIAGSMLTGCNSATRSNGPFFSAATSQPSEIAHVDSFAGSASRSHAMFVADGGPRTGESIAWPQVLEAVAWADVVILGEQHDDGAGHAVQLAVVEDAFALADRKPAVAMEMLERHEQSIAEDYLADRISALQLSELTGSANWGATGGWAKWYQPIVDAVKQAGGELVAANAPREYVRLARTGGYDELRSMSPERRALFELPLAEDHGRYRERFFDAMSNMGGHGAASASSNHATIDARRSSQDQHGQPSADDFLEVMFRSQLVWDATMGDSVARAVKRGRRPVLLLIGQFHSDFHGGTVQEIQYRVPDARILTISLQRTAVDSEAKTRPSALRAEDHERADIVVYTDG